MLFGVVDRKGDRRLLDALFYLVTVGMTQGVFEIRDDHAILPASQLFQVHAFQDLQKRQRHLFLAVFPVQLPGIRPDRRLKSLHQLQLRLFAALLGFPYRFK